MFAPVPEPFQEVGTTLQRQFWNPAVGHRLHHHIGLSGRLKTQRHRRSWLHTDDQRLQSAIDHVVVEFHMGSARVDPTLQDDNGPEVPERHVPECSRYTPAPAKVCLELIIGESPQQRLETDRRCGVGFQGLSLRQHSLLGVLRMRVSGKEAARTARGQEQPDAASSPWTATLMPTQRMPSRVEQKMDGDQSTSDRDRESDGSRYEEQRKADHARAEEQRLAERARYEERDSEVNDPAKAEERAQREKAERDAREESDRVRREEREVADRIRREEREVADQARRLERERADQARREEREKADRERSSG